MTEEKEKRIKSTAKTLGLEVCRGILIYVSFLIVSGLLNTVFLFSGLNLANELNIDAHPFYIASSVLLILPLFSINRAFELYDRESLRAFPFDTLTSYGFFVSIKVLFITPVLRRKFLTHLAVSVFMFLLFPYQLGYSYVVAALFPTFNVSSATAKLVCATVVIPAMFIFILLAKTSAHKWWIISQSEEQKRIMFHPHPRLRTFLEILKVFCIYIISFPMIPAVFMMVLSIILTFGIFTLWMWISIIGIILFLILFRRISSCIKRASFIRKMRRVLRENGYVVSKIKRPILSVLFPTGGTDFTIERDGIIYSCKLIGSINQSNPMYISPKGFVTERKTVSILKMDLFHIMTDTDFVMEGEKKIVILTPMSSKVYLNYGRTDINPDDGSGGGDLLTYTRVISSTLSGVKQNARGSHFHGPGYVSDLDRGIIKPFESGERVGEYKFFTPSGFLSAVDNNCLDR